MEGVCVTSMRCILSLVAPSSLFRSHWSWSSCLLLLGLDLLLGGQEKWSGMMGWVGEELAVAEGPTSQWDDCDGCDCGDR